MAVDLLSVWWVHTVTVAPRTGTRSGDEVMGSPYSQVGFYLDGTSIVAGPNGEQVAASGRFKFPAAAAFIPLGSRLTLPARFGGRVVSVVAVAVADAGNMPVPSHQEVSTR